MTVREILRYPHPLLRQEARLLTPEELRTPDIQALIRDMIDTLYHYPGTVGLAAPQVGASVQLLVMDATAKTTCDQLNVLINPVITAQSRWKFSREGCLSFPDYLVTVKRARKVTANWITPQGQQEEGGFWDFEAVILQHEIDHLHGILFLDRVRNIHTDLIRRTTPPPVCPPEGPSEEPSTEIPST